MKKILIAITGFLFFAIPVMAQPLVDSARAQIGKTLFYDPAYTKIEYPMGDVPIIRGVCSDVVIRAYRGIGIDLQKLVHDDMVARFASYPKTWGAKSTDKNIDHRRVPNLQVFFKKFGTSLPLDSDFAAGDIVTWNLRPGGTLPHIGIVSDKLNEKNIPYIVHNIGGGTMEEDMLYDYKITGHYRFKNNNQKD